MIGSVRLSAIYPVGDPIQILFELCDACGHASTSCSISLSITRVDDPDSPVGFGDLLEFLLRVYLFGYNPAHGGYFFEVPTWGFQPGYYDLWIAVNGVFQERLRIQIIEPTAVE